MYEYLQNIFMYFKIEINLLD